MVLFFKCYILLITNLCILEAVNYYYIRTPLFVKPLIKFFKRFRNKQHLFLNLTHSNLFKSLANSMGRALFERVVKHLAEICKILSQLHSKACFSVATISPDKPNTTSFRLTKRLFPFILKVKELIFLVKYIVNSKCSFHSVYLVNLVP